MGGGWQTLYRQAGLREATVQVRAGVYPAGHSRRIIGADLVRSMRPQIIELGLADEQELDELDAEVRKHFEDPEVLGDAIPKFPRLGSKANIRVTGNLPNREAKG